METSQIENTKTLGMKTHQLSFDKIPQFSKRDIAYTNAAKALRPFYKYPVELSAFEQVIEDKKPEVRFRKELVEALTHQCADLCAAPEVINNITALAHDNTFTIITAHQPSLFTGPLYYIYKIVSAINLAEQLNKKYPHYKFVPVFIIGAEDHDFEEINHVHLFGKKLVWENEEKGAVGQMKTASLKNVISELENILGQSKNAKTILEKIKKAYTEHALYGHAAKVFTHELFKDKGLVIANMNDAKLKRCFIPIIKQEILEQPSQKLVQATQEELAALGYKAQATAREINFFYLKNQLRERIVLNNGQFEVLNSNITFSRDEMEAEIDNHPERFSPNVIMRPLYQELIFPNLAYIGGGGELAYWTERKKQFEFFGINFPMLIRRNSVLWLDKGIAKKINKLALSIPDIFKDTESLIKTFVKNAAEEELHFDKEKEKLKSIFQEVFEKTIKVDQSLGKTVRAEEAKQLKALNQLEGRVHRAEKQKHETSLNQIRAIKAKLFPDNGLQERKDNFLAFYLKYGEQFLNVLF
ncbi:MAG TPA: bacillithiol biosynthesis cysteine-adding enzyme BshC, partial [Saprospiraceae bacterium]|nr:bacillithiol biosynthesis cysteine-adding enzyme BshC [Saprospiraceae bacterium]